MSVNQGLSRHNHPPPPGRKVVPLDDTERLSALSAYTSIGQSPDAALADLTQLAAQICQAPVAVIKMIDARRQRFVASFGDSSFSDRSFGDSSFNDSSFSNSTEASGNSAKETSLEDGFCPIAVSQGAPLIIEDTLADSRFSSNPAVVNQNIRFYAGIPLITPAGYSIGTLCVADFVPRQLSANQIDGLHALARQAMHQLNLRLDIDRVERVTQVLTSVSCGVANQVGETFFPTLVQRFTEILGVDYAYVALFHKEAPDRLETVAVSHRGQLSDNFSYSLVNTPCHEAILSGTFCHHPKDLQQLYPQMPLAAALGMESYAAMPIMDKYRQPIGVLAVMDAKPMLNEQPAGSLLTIFGSRIAAELERQQDHERQRSLLASEHEMRCQLEFANRMKDEFLAVISHELRSPLNPIVGWTKLLRRGGLSTEKIKSALASIERNALLQVGLIDDLLDIARILRGKLPLHQVPVVLTAVVEAAIGDVQLDAKGKSICIDFQDQSQNKKVRGDAARLQQVVGNLLDNAVKFTPAGGQIFTSLSIKDTMKEPISQLAQGIAEQPTAEVTTLPAADFTGSAERNNSERNHSECNHSKSDGYAHIQICDTGKGISPGFLPNAFDRFRQEDYSTTRQFGGLGLGLSIVQQLVKMHGGTIRVHSNGRDQGTSVDIWLPLL